jgi:hypothetical protein
VTEPSLVRLERLALGLSVAATTIAVVVPGGGARMAFGVLGGALLAGVSYWAIKRGVRGLADAMVGRSRTRRTPRGFVSFIARYALLAGMAYVMIARLRLHPIGLLAGASVIPLAAVIEAIRQIRPVRK